MDLTFNKYGAVSITLSRRNILALLAKLDGYPEGSACSIERGNGEWRLMVTAQEDDVHYEERKPGILHPTTEENL